MVRQVVFLFTFEKYYAIFQEHDKGYEMMQLSLI